MFRVEISYIEAGNNFKRVSCWQWKPSKTEIIAACRRRNQTLVHFNAREIKDETNNQSNRVPSGVCFRPDGINS
jgi:hypothetical protein